MTPGYYRHKRIKPEVEWQTVFCAYVYHRGRIYRLMQEPETCDWLLSHPRLGVQRFTHGGYPAAIDSLR